MNPEPVEKNELEKTLFVFEMAWFENPEIQVEEFLPDETTSNYLEILTELVRSEMEFRSESNIAFDVEQYFRRFPVLAVNMDARQSVVFEEYRLRKSKGEEICAKQHARRYGVESTSWPHLLVSESNELSQRKSPRTTLRSRTRIKFPNVGDSIGAFELVGQLGEGAFGRVFLAQQGELEGRLVVLKFTSQKTDEHRLLARLQHTNIVPIYSVHKIGELQAICMPLLGVATLGDFLNHCGQSGSDRISQHSHAMVQTVNKNREMTVVSTIHDKKNVNVFRTRQEIQTGETRWINDSTIREFASHFVRNMAEGLGFAHRRGIVHGDLKPANLLVSDDGEPIILDFHLAHSMADGIGEHVGGTLPYMAPEHLSAMSSNDVSLKPTMDVYSAGVILFELLTGKLPFDKELKSTFSTEQLSKFKQATFVVTEADRQLMGEDLAAIIETCLHPSPGKRFADGIELAEELQRSSSFKPLLRADNGSYRNRFGKWAKRHPRLASGSTIGVVSALIIAAIATMLWTSSVKLNRIAAAAASEKRIDDAKPLRAALATAEGLWDGSFFDAATSKGEDLIHENSWSDLERFRSNQNLRNLDPELAIGESLAAAEFHFWLAEAYRQTARMHDRDENLKKAIDHSQKSMSMWPNEFSKIGVLRQRQQIDPTYVVSTSPDSVERPDNPTDQLLSTYVKSGSLLEKTESYLRLASQDSDNFMNWLLLGSSCVATSNLEQAEACFTVSASLNRDSSVPLLHRGIARMELGKIKSALHDFEAADRLAPNDITILLNHALALGKNRDFQAALKKYDRAIELGAWETRTWYLRSRLKRALGDKQGADEDFQSFMRKVPTDEESCITKGNQLINSEPTEAIKYFETALKYNSHSKDAHNNIAHVYSEVLKQPSKAIDFMDKVIEIDKNNYTAIVTRGVLLARLNKIENAVRDANEALRMNKSADTKYRAAGIYAQLSKSDPSFRDKAFELLAQAAYENPRLVNRMSRDDPDIEPLEENDAFQSIFSAISDLEKEIAKNRPE